MDSASDVIQVLLVEDDEDHYILTRELLADISDKHYDLTWVQDYQGGLDALAENRHDLCLIDNRLGSGTGLDLLRAASAHNVSAPIIMLTGIGNRELDEQAMREGAADYLVKDDLTSELLERSIRYAAERQRLLRELSKLAKYDALTGLANRSLFDDFLAGAMARAERGQRFLGLMFLDLDHFKQVNDSFGHSAGDTVLIEVATRLKHCVRAGDLVARLGGDEFAIVLDDIGNKASACTVAQHVLDTLSPPTVIDADEVRIGISIGIALYPDGCVDAQTLLKAADSAMYEAKSDGRNSYKLHVGGPVSEFGAIAGDRST